MDSQNLTQLSKSWDSYSFPIGLWWWVFVLTCRSKEKNVFPWHGHWLKLFDDCCKFIPMFSHRCMQCCQLWCSIITFWCLNIPPSDRAVLIKSVRNGDHCAKYLSDFSEKPSGYPSSLKCSQCLHQIEEAWISDSMMIYNTFLLTREAPQIEIIKGSAELGQISNNRGRGKAR